MLKKVISNLAHKVELVHFGNLSAVMLCFRGGVRCLTVPETGYAPSTAQKSLSVQPAWLQEQLLCGHQLSARGGGTQPAGSLLMRSLCSRVGV